MICRTCCKEISVTEIALNGSKQYSTLEVNTSWLHVLYSPLLIEVLHCGNRNFRHFCSCDLHLDPMTFVHKPDLYHVKMCRMNKTKLLTSRLSKVIVFQTCIHTYRHTYATEIIYDAAWRVVNTCIRPCGRHCDHVAQPVLKILLCYQTTCRRLQRSRTVSVVGAVLAQPPATTRCRTTRIRSRWRRDLRGNHETGAA